MKKARHHGTSWLKRVTQSLGKYHIISVIFKHKVIVPNNIQTAAIKLRKKKQNKRTRKQRHKADLKPLCSKVLSVVTGTWD